MSKLKQVIIAFHEESWIISEYLRIKTKAKDPAHVIHKGLCLLKCFTEKLHSGCKIIVEQPNGERSYIDLDDIVGLK